jgi:hypothetical protein
VISSSFVTFLDINDNVRKIRALSLMDRDYFRALLETAGRMVDGKFVGSLYDEDAAFRNVVNAILLLCGLSPFWVDSEIVVRLLFGVGDEPAILLQLNFPPAPPKSSDDPEDEAPIDLSGFDATAWATAQLWAATGDYNQAMQIAQLEPWPFTQEVLRCRSYQIKMNDPEEVKKREKQAHKTRFAKDMSNPERRSKIQSLFEDESNLIEPTALL